MHIQKWDTSHLKHLHSSPKSFQENTTVHVTPKKGITVIT